MSDLNKFINNKVGVVTFDGRYLVGLLIGTDQANNIILQDCEERILSLEEPMEIAPLGLYIIRGDNVVILGGINEEKDKDVLSTVIKAEPINSVIY
ncbi:Sm-like ribonucleoprotein [Neoconidiobolus thromboides FSU 785]|nr:Sm-like ribonucleoprotein [Neoconidiobolus thromboides FSU 785]